jgi:SOS-response transcriptional repressor LexA/transcriptional regulator with XRE-family HTH domain
MPKSPRKSDGPPKPQWATSVSDLRRRLNLSQAIFGQRLHSSAMGVSRWERGVQEPASHSYIELGNLSGDPLCWYFWGRAGLRTEDLTRVLPKLRNRQRPAIDFQIVHAGGAGKKLSTPRLVALPVLKVAVASHGGMGDSSTLLQDAPIESMIAAPEEWCPNPASTFCLRVTGDSMWPLINDGYILAVDSSQIGKSELNDKVVIVWNKDMGLMVSRLLHYDHTEVLQPENKEYESIVLNDRNKWRILAKVLWWIGKAP